LKAGLFQLKKNILNRLQQIEKKNKVKILYACEAGSRAWGLASVQSDYDIRFIYVHQTEHYLCIDPVGVGKNKDVIELPLSESLDIVGWELTKALKLLRKSNPSLLEWMHSNIVYIKRFSAITRMKAMQESIFSPIACIYHYLNIAKKNLDQITSKQQITVKHALAILRPILVAKWIRQYNKFPPLDFLSLERLVADELIRTEIESLVKWKQKGNGDELVVLHDKMLSILTEEIDCLNNYVKNLDIRLPDPTDQLNKIFRDTLKEVWNSQK